MSQHRRREHEPFLPAPDSIREINGPFGWLDAKLVREDWLGRLGPEATTILAFLAIVANRKGASFYGRERMARMLGLDRRKLDRSLTRLVELELVVHHPWSEHTPDGMWQVLAVPKNPNADPESDDLRYYPTTLASTLERLFKPP